MANNLTTTERKTLAKCEKTIRDGLGTFFQVGQALWDIREGRLYRATHETFDGYCADVWEFSRQRAHQLITAAETVASVSTIVDTPPQRETHVRPLLSIPPNHRGEVWQDAVDSAPAGPDGSPRITARCVEEAVERWNQGRVQADDRGQRAEDRRAAPEVIDVESSPVATVEQPEATDHEITCPKCGHHETDADGDCAHCLEPGIVGAAGEMQDSVAGAESAPRAPERVDPALEAWGRIEQLARLWAAEYGGLAVAAARLENLAARLRAEA